MMNGGCELSGTCIGHEFGSMFEGFPPIHGQMAKYLGSTNIVKVNIAAAIGAGQ